ncbi:ATP-dependent 6-phosphofructokinase [Psychrobium sp. 1_MG-2023]|uniref:ATP-dependent 6-phosphofructokinase n=1 Tax=Psychrobium sp. 1_MG-2023 TaxID=3062624 RepID=UPI002732E0EB|nr:ATP-dependent 6-phosphofructokinase [Psychrobium sp. 1_MG-2023]MDP2559951.1 ATP-dependent 6-phosphofructokinase [Psychrobium sp. 1_MG-2023]
MRKINTIGVLTSGGDAPGMNAAIRAIVLTAQHHGISVTGFKRGFNGLLNGEHFQLTECYVRDIIHHGGTVLKSARCQAFTTEQGQLQASEVLNRLAIDCLIVIGGDGSLRGAELLADYWSGQIIGLPGTIDNDVAGADKTIGFATAVNTAVEAIDKIRDTADAFERTFLVEVMGRESGYIAMSVAIACAAEQVLTFESRQLPSQQLASIVNHITNAQKSRGNSSYIMVIAENLWPTGTIELAKELTEQSNIECQPCILGHIQRGGRPVFEDRILATKLGVAAVEASVDGAHLVMLGEVNQSITATPLSKLALEHKTIDTFLFNAQQQIFEYHDFHD